MTTLNFSCPLIPAIPDGTSICPSPMASPPIPTHSAFCQTIQTILNPWRASCRSSGLTLLEPMQPSWAAVSTTASPSAQVIPHVSLRVRRLSLRRLRRAPQFGDKRRAHEGGQALRVRGRRVRDAAGGFGRRPRARPAAAAPAGHFHSGHRAAPVPGLPPVSGTCCSFSRFRGARVFSSSPRWFICDTGCRV